MGTNSELVQSGQLQLKHFGQFIDQNQKVLQKCLAQHLLLTNGESQISNSKSWSTATIIGLDYSTNRENLTLFQLIESDNKVLNKIMLVFANLIEQTHKMCQQFEETYRDFLLIDEEFTGETSSATTIRCSQFLEFFFSTKSQVKQLQNLILNLVKQVAALCNLEIFISTSSKSINYLQFQTIFQYISESLQMIQIFDEIITNSNLRQVWMVYRKSIKTMRTNLSHFGNEFSRNSVDGIESVLDDLNWLFEGKAFQELLENISEVRAEFHGKSVSYFSAHLLMYLKTKYSELEKLSPSLSDFNETQEVLRLTLMCGLYHQLFGNLDQKHIRNVLELNNKHQGITLIGNTIWCWEVFIKTNFPTLLKGANEKYANEAPKQRRQFLQTRIQTLIKETQTYGIQICDWVYKMQKSLKADSSSLKLEHLRQRCNLFLQGVQYAGQISQIIKSTANLCILFKLPMQKGCLLAICKLLEFLKIIKTTFELKQHSVADSVQCICRYLEYQALFILQSAKKKVTGEVSTAYNERSIDVLSALQIAEKALYGPGTAQRVQVFRLAIGLADPATTFSVDYQSKLQKILFRLEVVSNLQLYVSKACDSTFLFWHQSLLPIYLKSLLDTNQDLQKLQYVVHCTTDCSDLVAKRYDLDGEKVAFKAFQSNFIEAIDEQVIKKLESNIETFLRLDHHSNLQLEKFNPFMTGMASNMELYQKGKLLIQLRAMNVFGRHLLMKDFIEHYLSEMFYNLTTVTLHDWKTYGEIRCLARTKFNLKTTEDLLPTQQLEQGLDILEIMRNIHVFVDKYLYNLNNQIFIEHTSTANKHLNTINIRHIANSLRTHGGGIINTTINFIYQFLRKKFASFSQFLFDEHIQSRLIKDLKYFRDNKERLNQNYSYDRAEAFCRGIRKLGLSPTGESFLDLFRTLISHIGNAMGYVRMIRSGSFHSASEACVYLPTLQSFEDDELEGQHTTSFQEAFKNLQEVVKSLSNNYVAGTEYFQLLVTAFAPFFQNPKNAHLNNFYLIIPPLTLNFVEHLLSAKDKITKKNKDGSGHFTDDGFAMGIAYILKLLNQTSNFNSLHWFKSIRAKYIADKEKLLQQTQTADKNDDKLQQTLLLTDRRITAFQQEFDLLYYNLSSAKIFFQ